MDNNEISDLTEHRIFGKLLLMAENHPHRKEMCSLHAAAIVRGGSILSVGINKPKRNSFVDIHAHHKGCTVHAEVDAILKIRKKIDLTGAKIYVVRVKKINEKPGNSAPCQMCQAVLKKYGFKRAYYTTEERTIEIMKF